MKKLGFLAIMVTLILQSFLSPIGAYANSKHTFLLSNEVIEENPVDPAQVIVTYDWVFTGNSSEEEKVYFYLLPKTIEVVNEQIGTLSAANKQIGSFIVSSKGITVTVFPNTVEETGSFQFNAIKKGTQNKSLTEEDQMKEKTEYTDSSSADSGLPKTVIAEDPLINGGNGVDSEEETGKQIIEENILTNATLSYENRSGEKVDEVDLESIISVTYEWELPNGHPYKEGATFEFDLPQELKVYETITNQDILYNNNPIGTFSVDNNGRVTMVFNGFIQSHSNIRGTLEVLSSIRETIVVTEDRKVEVTPIEGHATSTIPIAFTPKGNTIDKKGIPDKGYNAKNIYWTIDFNKHLEDIQNAVLTDPLLEGQALQPGSIKIYELYTKMDGSVEQGREITASIGKTKDGKDFKIQFGNIKSAYRVTFVTDITNPDGTIYENTATLSGDTIDAVNASASVEVKRGVPLAKISKGYSGPTQTITWEINFNYNEKTISATESVLTDLFTDTQEFVNGSLKVEKVTIGDDGSESASEEISEDKYSFTFATAEKKTGFILQFKENIQEAYKITYQTKAKDRVFDQETITNTVQYGNQTKTATRTINQQILSKFHGTPNYKEKEISWTVEFNKDNYPMKNVVLTDTFPNKGLTLLEDTLKIWHDSTLLVYGQDYELDTDSFNVTFKRDITSKVKMEYITKFDFEVRADLSKKYLENHVHLTWKDEFGKELVKNTTSRFTPDTYTQSNGFKNGSYNAITKEITWNVGINYNLKEISEASVEDFISEGQALVEDSLVVKEMLLTGNPNGIEVKELKENLDYTIELNPDGKKGFKVIFKEKINSPYLLSYKTSLEGELIKKEYQNKATLYDKETILTDLFAKVSVTHGGEFTDKTGEQNGKMINWEVNINFSQSKISNVKILDKPTKNQKLLKGSFHLFSTSVAMDGTVTKSEEVSPDEYEVKINITEDGQETFELVFNKDIEKPYILEYQSLILAKVGDEIKNDVTLIGEQISSTEVTTSESLIKVKRTTGMGTGEGEVGSLTVKKVDAADGHVLQGAVFTLIDATSGATVDTLTTNADGVVVFDRLLFGEYLLKEARAPEGYLVGINDTVPVELAEVHQQLEIKNVKIHQGVELTKVDSRNEAKVLSGAGFELQLKVNGDYKTISSHYTNENGQIIVNNLQPGEYQFVEVRAPYYYKLDPTPIPFVIRENQTEVIKVVKENEPGGPGPDPVTPEVPHEPEDPTYPGDEEEPEKTGDNESPDNPGNEEKPTESGDNGDPNNPKEQNDPDTPVTPGQTDGISKDETGSVLPQTGEDSDNRRFLSGITLIILGLFYSLEEDRNYRSRKKEKLFLIVKD
ncbi:collagen binding domain-containing protein [Fredinandcohnia humi]